MKKCSIVVPVYFNELNLPKTIPRLLDLQEKLPDIELEIIFVDDGSGDKSLEILLDFQKKTPHIIKIVKLTRNFGALNAIHAGLSVASGDCVGAISADLQDPPELLVDMIKKWEQGNRAIFAIRKDRKDPLLSKIAAKIFYKLLRKFALPDYPPGGFDFFVIDRYIVEHIKTINEKNSSLMNLIFWLGFDYVAIPYVREKRQEGKSRWTFSKKIKLVIDSFIGFSYMPIKLLPILGSIFALGSFIYGLMAIINWVNGKIPIEGWTTTIVIVTFIGGVQMIMLGVLGEYLWRTLDETRRRPPYIIDRIYHDKDSKL